jgi:hypothetical protein
LEDDLMKAQLIVTGRKWILASAAFLSLTLAGCQVDPFPADGRITPEKPVERPVAKPWGIEVPERLDFAEGETSEYTVRAHVPAPATPILAVVDLPPGATFDPATGKLSWEPDYSAGNDPRDPASLSRSYQSRVLLSSSLEPQSVVEKSITLVVRNTARAVDLEWSESDFELTEGRTFTSSVDIKSEDYPAGPFQFFITGLPSGVQVARDSVNPARFNVDYTPGLDLVTRNDDYSGGVFSKTWKAEAVVVDPSGRKTVTNLDWKILDSRLEPEISAPSSVQQLDDIRIQVLSIDPNLEDAPVVNVVKPKFGVLDVEDEEEGFTTRTSIRWHSIPEDKIGTTSELKIRACVYGSSWQKNKCFLKSVLVKIEPRPLSEPVVDRSRWMLGEVRYLRADSSMRIRIPVRNPNAGGTGYSVSIEPESLRSEVQYVSGELVISPTTPGFRQFNINVRIPQGLSRIESFSYEALPKNWSRVLVLGDGLRDPEVAGTLGLIPGAQVVNPLMQDMNDRTLALREAVVLGTSLLSDQAAFAAAKPALDRVAIVMVQSPRIDGAGTSFWTELGSIGLKLQGRVSAVLGSNFPGLALLPVSRASGSGLSAPIGKLLLNGSLTAESANPTLLAASSSNCKSVLQFSYAPVSSLPPYELPIAMKCERNGKRWIISGMEWSDLSAQSAGDQKIVSTWMQEVLK